MCALPWPALRRWNRLATTRCNPLSRNRNGINIGEGAALFLVEPRAGNGALARLGRIVRWPPYVGARSRRRRCAIGDGTGFVTRRCRRAARSSILICTAQRRCKTTPWKRAWCTPCSATGCRSARPSRLPGHALGAAGAIEAGLCWLAMQDDNTTGKLPPHLWDGLADPALPALNIVEPGARLGHPLRCAVSNSFAFGGANATLVLGRE